MKIKISKIRQLMGRLVVVTKVAKLRSVAPAWLELMWRPEDIELRAGWVVGVRWYRTTVHTPIDGGFISKQVGPAVPHLLVCFWPTQRPVRVPMDGWRRRSTLPEAENPDPLPWDGQWDERERELVRDQAREQGRDEKGGRFC